MIREAFTEDDSDTQALYLDSLLTRNVTKLELFLETLANGCGTVKR